MAKIAPYGSWQSPITSDLIVAESIGLGSIGLDGDDIYWLEMRPGEGGRSVLVRRAPDGTVTALTPTGFNVRSRVHEYGGGSYAVAGGTVYFTNFADQRLYRQKPGAAPEPLTPAGADRRYADYVLDGRRLRLIAVREDHSGGGEAVNSIVSVGLGLGGDDPGRVLISGNNFYSTPRLSPDGSHLAWLTWNHPNMPWDGCELWLADVNAGGDLTGARRVAGGPAESVFQPEWSPDGTLYFVSDRTGWWNLYRLGATGPEPLWEKAAEFGLPQWVFGMRTYAFAGPRQLICAYTEQGIWHLATLDSLTGEAVAADLPYTLYGSLRAGAFQAVFLAGSATEPTAVVRLDLGSGKRQVLQRASTVSVDPGYISPPQAVEFPTTGGRTAHAIYYAPRNRDCTAPPGERPPLKVVSHGGPTAAATPTLDLEVQYWTSRGFAVLDVNYGGSTGYGRPYRERLQGQWGVVDVDDCCQGALYLAGQGQADPARLTISGGSAGGYTTLCALAFRQVFKAGASYFGVSDAEALARDTHKFESRYLDSLIGPYPAAAALYRQRSPVHYCQQIACPVIFFQGLEDRVVPPSQAEVMVGALRARGLPVAYLAYEGEQHGFRRAENIKRSLDAELYFYGRVLGFSPAGAIEPVPIDNLPT